MRTAYIQGHWPCEVLGTEHGLTAVRFNGCVFHFQPWLIETKRRR